MSETTEAAVETHDEAHDDHHPSDWEYVKVAIILAVVTAAEVATYFESVFTFFETRWILLTSLFTMMIFKGWLVARVFMHLKQDKPVLQQSFFAGVVLATAVYIVTLLAFNVFG